MIVVSIVVDAQRMHITKNDWDVFVDDFASQTGKKVKEQLDQFVDVPYFADSGARAARASRIGHNL